MLTAEVRSLLFTRRPVGIVFVGPSVAARKPLHGGRLSSRRCKRVLEECSLS